MSHVEESSSHSFVWETLAWCLRICSSECPFHVQGRLDCESSKLKLIRLHQLVRRSGVLGFLLQGGQLKAVAKNSVGLCVMREPPWTMEMSRNESISLPRAAGDENYSKYAIEVRVRYKSHVWCIEQSQKCKIQKIGSERTISSLCVIMCILLLSPRRQLTSSPNHLLRSTS